MHSVALVTCCGIDDDEVASRAARIGREVEELKENGLAGSPSEIVAKLEDYAKIGVTRVYLQILDIDDLQHVELLASQVLSRVQ